MRKTQNQYFKASSLIIAVACGLVNFAWSQPVKTERKSLDQPAEIQGYPCAKGYAWLYSDESLNRCTLSRPAAFGEAQAPAGSIISLRSDGKPEYLMLAHDTSVAGYVCSGGGILGPAEGPVVAFYPSGKLKLCFLAGDQIVQGVPCMGSSFFRDVFGGGAGANFYESGKLRECKLSKDYGTLKRGEHFIQKEK